MLSHCPVSNSYCFHAIGEEEDLNATIWRISHEGIFIRWQQFNESNTDQRFFLGYKVYYKEVNSYQVDIDEDRDICTDR